MLAKMENMQDALLRMGAKAVAASRMLATLPPTAKLECLNRMADELLTRRTAILEANRRDVDTAVKNGISGAMLDRLKLDDARIEAMATGLREVAAQLDPVGKLIFSVIRPNGLQIDKITVPLGVVAIIYESRPNVTADAAGICLKAGNAVMLRGGSEAFNSNCVIAEILNQAAMLCGLPDGAVQLLPWTDRGAVNLMLKMDRFIDLVIPRGGEGLIRAVMAESTIPVLKHYKGVCHTFIDDGCDLDMALKIVENAKCQRPSACNAMETLLIDRRAAKKFIPPFVELMKKNKVELRGDEAFRAFAPDALPATTDDYYAEYLDLVLAVRIVDGVREAVEHINTYGSRHSEAIVSENAANVDYFFKNVDASSLFHNTSTRFADGGEFGMGAEIGISTDKLHARGPMGADELVTTKFIVHGRGQVRG
jgi:glutamate-5-semialdehyde dehydrogenase